jgi:hypothetical protein
MGELRLISLPEQKKKRETNLIRASLSVLNTFSKVEFWPSSQNSHFQRIHNGSPGRFLSLKDMGKPSQNLPAS